jgi:O-antigen/teichoic acid export membrane protein
MSERRFGTPPTAEVHSRFRRFVERLGVPLVLADQCLVSGATFLSTILLARFLGVEAFGRLALVLTVVLVVNSLQNAAVMQPMMSIGAKCSETEAPAYYGAVVLQQLLVSAISFIALAIGVEATAIVLPDWSILGLAIPLGAAVFAGQTQDFFRRYLFARRRPVAALMNDGIRYSSQIFLLYAVNRVSSALVISMALWVMAAGAMLGAVHGVLCLEKLSFNAQVLRKAMWRHWQFTKWLVPSTVMSWCTGHVFFLMSGVVLGVATAGILRAAQTIFGVVHILFIAVDNFAPVHASEIFHRQGSAALHRYLKGLTWKLGGAFLVLLLLINVNGTAITRLLYGSDYPAMTYLLLGFSIIYSVPLLAKILHVWVLAIESTEVEFVPWVVAVAFTAVAAYPFVALGGIPGVFSGTFLVDAIWAAMTFQALGRNMRRKLVVDF